MNRIKSLPVAWVLVDGDGKILPIFSLVPQPWTYPFPSADEAHRYSLEARPSCSVIPLFADIR